jgi:hypothetical protein
MASRKSTPSQKVRSAAAAGSWLALLAAATLGDAADTVRAEVRADGLANDGGVYRLVVQSYDSATGGVPGPSRRPLGSVQRAVTADELKQGVQVNLIGFRAPSEREQPVVVAWIEAGEPDLEFDGRTARPGPGSVYGSMRREDGGNVVQISLKRRLV